LKSEEVFLVDGGTVCVESLEIEAEGGCADFGDANEGFYDFAVGHSGATYIFEEDGVEGFGRIALVEEVVFDVEVILAVVFFEGEGGGGRIPGGR
jgi:hypothetical protein